MCAVVTTSPTPSRRGDEPLSENAIQNGRVSEEYATLLAQVVPVLALALGLEVRALLDRPKQQRVAAPADAEEPKPSPWTAGFWTGAFGFILASLAGIEVRALSVVAGPGFWGNVAVPLATAAVFLAPVPWGLYVGQRIDGIASRRATATAAACTAALVGVVVLAYFVSL